jgi:hypothetical protein
MEKPRPDNVIATKRSPTIFDVSRAIHADTPDERGEAIARLRIVDVVFDTDTIGSVCVGILADGSIFVDADDAVIADALTSRPSLAETMTRLVPLMEGWSE